MKMDGSADYTSAKTKRRRTTKEKQLICIAPTPKETFTHTDKTFSVGVVHGVPVTSTPISRRGNLLSRKETIGAGRRDAAASRGFVVTEPRNSKLRRMAYMRSKKWKKERAFFGWPTCNVNRRCPRQRRDGGGTAAQTHSSSRLGHTHIHTHAHAHLNAMIGSTRTTAAQNTSIARMHSLPSAMVAACSNSSDLRSLD